MIVGRIPAARGHIDPAPQSVLARYGSAGLQFDGLGFTQVFEALGDGERVGPRRQAHVEGAIHVEGSVGLDGVAFGPVLGAEHDGDGLAGDGNRRFGYGHSSMDFGTLALLVLEAHAHRRWLPGGGVEDADCERGFAAGLRELQQGAGEQDGQEQADDCGIAHLRAVYIVHLGGDGTSKEIGGRKR